MKFCFWWSLYVGAQGLCTWSQAPSLASLVSGECNANPRPASWSQGKVACLGDESLLASVKAAKPRKLTQRFPGKRMIYPGTLHTVVPGTVLGPGEAAGNKTRAHIHHWFSPNEASKGSCSLKFHMGCGPLGG